MALPEYFEFHDRTKMVFGPGTLAQVGEEAKKLGGGNAVIVTDKVIRDLGFCAKAVASLDREGVSTVLIRDDVPQDSDASLIGEIAADAAEKGADMCIGIGGGSCLDTMKMVNLLLSEGGDLLADHQGAYVQERPLRPMIAIPTTAGTGSEVTFAAVIKDRAENMKVSFVSHYFAPDCAVLDPELTLTMPLSITAYTGMDALTHAVESLHSTESTPVTDVLAEGAIRMIAENLPAVMKDGENLEARGQMLLASSIAGLAFANALVGIVHGIAHSIGGVAGVPHGLANSIMLPWGLEYNIDECPEKYAIMARALGAKPGGGAKAEAERGIELIRELIGGLGIPQGLSEAGVREDQLEAIADLTMGDGTIFTNPRPVEDPEEVLELLKKAF